MAIAMPVTDRARVAGHFAKANAFAVYSDEGQLIRIDNSQDGGCGQKKRLVKVFKEMQVTKVVLRNIGERSLARLLNAGIEVERLTRGATIAQVLDGSIATNALTEAAQGRPCKPKSSKCCGHKSPPKLLETAPGALSRADGALPKIKLN
ncbi:NifB/NifX family molybdenum-iron cluster-binding protein [Ferrimonas sp. YFM]|uniref:NifB/NifX family molybdenum-iron cluster-binding protein n=1 Tax=Ferrimonas sp. YFM TaxID=3028878 RepID=UPI0025736FED|nr:NifB/NifX family molybdenum-iron cluster-binding protein [Ferrimonas sp. YFM]BDY03384.1 dinitrogenase iron-molybdenum cofactor domain protein [Ferrimonas sp. YFM]